MNLDPFRAPGTTPSKSQSEIFVKSKNGGLGRRSAPAEPLEPMEIPEAEAAPEPEKKQPTVVLSRHPAVRRDQTCKAATFFIGPLSGKDKIMDPNTRNF